MATSYTIPGTYVEEIFSGARPVTALGTSTPAFIGCAPLAKANLNEAVAVNNWREFCRKFVGDAKDSTDLARAVYGHFQNEGGRCYILNVGMKAGKPAPLAGAGGAGRSGISVLETVDEVKIVCAPGYTDVTSYDKLIGHCEKMKNCFAILDAPNDIKDINQLKVVGTAKGGGSGGGGEGKPAAGVRPRNSDSGHAAFYYPWIYAADPITGEIVPTPPSGHIAGVYGRVDATRGVFKAPANESIRGALDLTYKITAEEQGELNTAGVNCIRFFNDAGIRIWGARTLADPSSEWKYIPVRRLFNMIEESIGAGTRWIVFEPNDSRTWKSIVRDIGNFLTLIWRSGALKGATPEQAFFVKCDDETNPPDVIDAGRLVTEIGVAPVKPAEFIIFRIGQWEGGTETEEGESESEETE